MGYHRTHNPILLLYVTHAPSDAEERSDKRQCSPEAHILAKQTKVKEQVSCVYEVKLIVGRLKSLWLDGVYFGEKQPPVPFFKNWINTA